MDNSELLQGLSERQDLLRMAARMCSGRRLKFRRRRLDLSQGPRGKAGCRFWVADEGRDVITTDGPVHQDSLLRYFSRIRFNNAERSAGPQVKCRMRPNQYALRVPISIRAQVSVPLGVLAVLDEEQCARASAEQN